MMAGFYVIPGEAESQVRYPGVEVSVPAGAWAFMVAGHAATAMRQAGVGYDEIDAYFGELADCDDFDSMLGVVKRWVTVT